MCARLTSLLLATALVAGVGCVSKPAKEPAVAASTDRACAGDSSNPLHLTSSAASQVIDHDPDIDSILTQPTSDRRLAQINRRMYQSLRMLDAELRREDRIAACERRSFGSETLQAKASDQASAGAGGGSASIGQSAGGAGGTGGIAVGLPLSSSGASGGATASGMATQASGAPTPTSATSAAARSTSIRKASLSANGGGGNGATAPRIVPGNDNDIVARRLRKAAEQETNPTLRAKLWKEYTDYRQGTSAK